MQQYACVERAAVSNHSHLKWHAGFSALNKNRKPNCIIMSWNCFINVSPHTYTHCFPLFLLSLEASCILLSIAHSSSPLALSPWRESQKVFIYLRPKTKHKTRLPRETHEETANTLSQISDLAGAENNTRAFVLLGRRFPRAPPTPCCHWTFRRCAWGIQKNTFRFLLGERRKKTISKTKVNFIDLPSACGRLEKKGMLVTSQRVWVNDVRMCGAWAALCRIDQIWSMLGSR